jgi:alanyl-tRNA synthetase
LRESPFYAESGGQISDAGEIVGEGWRVDVDDVRKVNGKPAAIGKSSGSVKPGHVRAVVPRDQRLDTERNHTATHLLHAALREVLGDHVHQAGSLVAPDRLRFDFSHTGPMTPEQIRTVEEIVNRGVLSATPVVTREQAYQEAVASGAMALFGEKYGDVVRVVDIPTLSTELCGGTHARNTAEIGLFHIVSESGIAAGVRRIEAITGSKAYEWVREQEQTVKAVAELVKATPAMVVKRVQGVVDERRAFEKRIADMMRGGGTGGPVKALLDSAVEIGGLRVVAGRSDAADAKEVQGVAEAISEQAKNAVVVLVAAFEEGKHTLVVAAGEDARARGVRADAVLKALAAVVGGRGGGKPTMAQAGLPSSEAGETVLAQAERILGEQLGVGA